MLKEKRTLSARNICNKNIAIEYINESKRNKIVDNRLDERNTNLSASEKAEKRFILQRKQLFSNKKNAKFNLNNNINDNIKDKFSFFPQNKNFNLKKKIKKDDEEEISSDLVALASFGGGTFDNKNKTENLTPINCLKRRDVLDNIISISKQAKALKQMEQESQENNTDRLNQLFNKLKSSGVLQLKKFYSDNTSSSNENLSTFKNTYDFIYRELQFDNGKKAQATSTKMNFESGKPEDFENLLEEFNRFSSSFTEKNIINLNNIMRQIFKQAKIYPFICGLNILKAIEAKRFETLENFKINEVYGGIPFSIVCFFRMISEIFPIFERYNFISLPTFIYAMEIIVISRVRCLKHIAQVLYFCHILSKWVSVSRAYLPEVVAFLRGSLLLCIENLEYEIFPSHSFPITAPYRRMLYIDNKIDKNKEINYKLSILDIFNDQENNENNAAIYKNQDLFKIRVINSLLETIDRFVEVYVNQTISFHYIFKPFVSLLERLPLNNYPNEIKDKVLNLINSINVKIDKVSQLSYLKYSTFNETKSLVMLEPKFEYNFSFKKSTGKEKKLILMKQKLRKETRGALKKLRKDSRFIGRLQNERNIKISNERRLKTKHILANLQSQESEYKKRKAKKF